MAGLPSNLREFDDTDKTRQLIFDNCLDAVSKRFPIEDDEYRLELSNVRYDGPTDYSLEQQKQALLKSRNLRSAIKGTWRLVHKPTNTVLDERDDTVLQVPYYTNRGTFINNGNDYSIITQMRLRPGVYARRKRTGELETHFNIRPGTGRGFRFNLNPESGEFQLTVGQSHVPLYPILRGMGVSDEDIMKAWGADVTAANAKRTDAQALQKTYKRMAGAKANPTANPMEMGQFIKDAVEKYEVDPEIVARTMGIETDHVTPQLLLRASQKLLDINRGDAQPDNRDNPRYTQVYSVEDLLAERINRDAGRLTKSLLWKARRDGTLKRVPKNALTPYLDSFITGSGLTMPGEEANPLSNLEQMSRITRFGEGGIRSADSVTDEAHDVNGDWLGFVDPIAGPEGCHPPDAEVFTSGGWVRWEDVDSKTEFACLVDGKLTFSKPVAIHVYDYKGKLYGCRNSRMSYLVTANHRVWCRNTTKGAEYGFEKASSIRGQRIVMAGGHGPSDFDEPVDVRRKVMDSLAPGGVFHTYCIGTARMFEHLAFGLGHQVGVREGVDKSGAHYWHVRAYKGGEVYVEDCQRYTVPYTGKVYCATVPGGLMYCRYGEYGGHWTGNSKIGVDVRASYRTFKGNDHKLYGEFINAKTGETEYVDIGTAADKVVAFPGQDMNAQTVFAMRDDVPTRVNTSEVDYMVPSFAHMGGSNMNMNPMPTAVQAGRQFYGSKFWAQYLPQAKGEVPLVDSLMPDGQTTFSEYYGRRIGTLTSKVDGTVIAVDDNSVTVKDALGKKHKIEMVSGLPFNRLSAISYTPVVKVGQDVKAGDMLANSNYTDAKTGAINMGQNLKVAIIPYNGQSVSGDTNVFWKNGDRCSFGPISDVRPGNGMMSQATDPATMNTLAAACNAWMIHSPASPMKEIELASGTTVKVTDDHSLMLLNGFWMHPVKVSEAAVGDKVPYARPSIPFGADTEIVCPGRNGHGYKVELDHDFGMLVGMYLTRGQIDCKRDFPRRIYVMCGMNQAYQIDEICGRLKLVCRYRPKLRPSGSIVSSAPLAQWFADNLGRRPWDKHIPDIAWTAGQDFIEGILDGCAWSMGIVPKDGRGLDITLCSRTLAEGLGFYLSSLGCRHSIRKVPNTSGAYPRYRLSVPAEYCGLLPTFSHPDISEGLANLVRNTPQNGGSNVWSDEIAAIRDIPSEPYVYDLDMQPYGTFLVADGLVVHNSFEDAHVISESAAKRLATDRMYSTQLETRNGVEADKNKYMAAFPNKFTKAQFETLDEHGMAKVGTELHKGDPIVVAIGPKVLSSSDVQLGKLSKTLRNALTDKAEVWEHDWPGVVTDAVMTQSGARVNVKTTPPVAVGDKLSPRFGLKGVVGSILPDDQMPRDAATNQPYDMLVNPMGFLSRVAPGQIMEIALGKLAKARGQQVRLPQLPPKEGWATWVKGQMDAAGVKDATDVFDPATGKTIPNVGDGYMYVSAFHHLAEKKSSARGLDGAYTQDEQPAKGGYTGAKRMSGLDLYALLAHGATDVVKDYVTVRGTKNDGYWNALRLGLPIPEPGVPFVYDKFLNTLKAGGINVVEKGNVTKILPMTDKDIDKLSGTRLITSSEMVDADFSPVKGGLFDPGKTGGMSGNFWSAIPLPEPVPNPIMEEPIRRVLGLTTKKMEAILSGAEKLNGKTGGEALKDALEHIDIDDRITQARADIQNRRGSVRDNAIKVLRYLTSMKEQELKPSDWMISKVPVIPPKFRPVSKMGNVALVSDLNDLYKEVIENANLYKDLHKELPDDATTEERLNLYRSVKAAYGLGESITPEGQAKGLKGAVRQVIGDIPKTGMFQRKVISKAVDTVSRNAITPDPNLDMDQIGIPEDAAWSMYKPFVMRALVRRGYPPTTAIRMLDEKDKTARQFLEEEMEKRPVMMDRAPTWHKFNIMAFKPTIVDSETVHVCPLVVGGFNADFDGDRNIGSVVISAKKQAIHEKFTGIPESSCKSVLNLVNYYVELGERTTCMFTRTKAIAKTSDNTAFITDLADFPHGELTNVRKDEKYDIEFYSVPEGTRVVAYDETTCQPVLAPVAYWSKHKGKTVEIVNLSDGRQLLVDDDPRAIYGIASDGDSLVPKRFTPTDAKDHGVLVPVVNDVVASDLKDMWYDFDTGVVSDTRNDHSVALDYSFGQYVGLIAGDGWSSGDESYLADNEEYNSTWMTGFLKTVYPETTIKTYVQKASEDASRYGDSKIHRVSVGTVKLARRVKELVGGERDSRTSGSANKRLPHWFQFAGKDFLRGVVNGIIATDGTVSVSHAKDKPQLMIAMGSTSLRLVREFRRCCQLLGVSASICFSKTTVAGNSAWMCMVSSIDAKKIGLLDNCCNTRKRDIFLSTHVEMGSQYIKNDLLPFPRKLADRIIPLIPAYKIKKQDRLDTSPDMVFRCECYSAAINTRNRRDMGTITRCLVYQLKYIGEYLAQRSTENYEKFSNLIAVIESRFSPYFDKDSGESRRSWKVSVSAEEISTLVTGAESVRSKIRPETTGRLAEMTRLFTQLRMKGFITLAQFERLRLFKSDFSANTDLADSRDLADLLRLANAKVSWASIDSVDKTGVVETGYDLTVPGYETFLSDEGVVLSNTVNFHVPVSDKAVKNAMDRMLPSENLISLTDLKSARHPVSKEQVLGLFNLTQPANGKPPKVFRTVSEAKQAYAKGEIGMNDPIEILQR